MNWLTDFTKGVVAFFASLLSVLIGILSAWMAFILVGVAAATGPCFQNIGIGLLAACLVPVFLRILPRYIYHWRYGFPTVPPRPQSPRLMRLRKASPF